MHFLTNTANLPGCGNYSKDKQMTDKHWSKVEYLHETVQNPNIIIKAPKAIIATLTRRILKIMSCATFTAIHIPEPILSRYGHTINFISVIMSASVPKRLF